MKNTTESKAQHFVVDVNCSISGFHHIPVCAEDREAAIRKVEQEFGWQADVLTARPVHPEGRLLAWLIIFFVIALAIMIGRFNA
ncbi:hypothetical protein [Mucilaginibacter gynuensis]|uniref:hypothetical protein n=1 Tax=Mucilaginibacter gynuensis TaxID=1302236 RepID=UPI0031E9C57A